MDKQLEEQLERMRQLNERLNEMHRGVAENSELIARDRRRPSAPRHDVRDDFPSEAHGSRRERRAASKTARRRRR